MPENRPQSKNEGYHHAIMSKRHRHQFKVVSAAKSETIGTSKWIVKVTHIPLNLEFLKDVNEKTE